MIVVVACAGGAGTGDVAGVSPWLRLRPRSSGEAERERLGELSKEGGMELFVGVEGADDSDDSRL